MTAPQASQEGRYRNLGREEAIRLLQKRMMVLGGFLGGVMSVVWVATGALLFPAFPAFGSPLFLMFFFAALVLLAAVGSYAGRRYVRRLTR